MDGDTLAAVDGCPALSGVRIPSDRCFRAYSAASARARLASGCLEAPAPPVESTLAFASGGAGLDFASDEIVAPPKVSDFLSRGEIALVLAVRP